MKTVATDRQIIHKPVSKLAFWKYFREWKARVDLAFPKWLSFFKKYFGITE